MSTMCEQYVVNNVPLGTHAQNVPPSISTLYRLHNTEAGLHALRHTVPCTTATQRQLGLRYTGP
jgi:hypothetical protein